jgi:hypothetical protein
MSPICVPGSPYFHVVLIVNGNRYQKSARDLNALLEQQSADLVDLGRAPLHDQTAHAMDRLDVPLLDAFHRNKAHVGALGGLANRLGVGGVVLVRLHERFDELGGDQAHHRTEGAKQPRPVMGAAAGLHRHRARRQLRHELAQPSATQFLAEQ